MGLVGDTVFEAPSPALGTDLSPWAGSPDFQPLYLKKASAPYRNMATKPKKAAAARHS